jgi:alpha-beta hydrolase superfamily lysophospholipase/thiol-disulfide isomerase/thioredoxin
MSPEKNKTLSWSHLVQPRNRASLQGAPALRSRAQKWKQATILSLALYLVPGYLASPLISPSEAWSTWGNLSRKTVKIAKSEKVSKEEAVCEKLKVGGDVPVVAWTDPTVKPWAAVLCIHGLGLHKESFLELGKRLSRVGVLTYAIDVRGFGAWLKTKSLNRVDFGQAMKDVGVTLKAIHLSHPELPIIVLGESMGGAIALQSAAMYPDLVDGLVSSVPSGDRFGQKVTNAKVAFGFLSRPNRPIDLGNKIVSQASEDEMVQQNWSDDPKARLQLSAKELVQFQLFMNQNHSRAKHIEKTPSLILQGANDRLVKPASTIEIFNEICTPQKDLLMIGNSEHLIFENAQIDDHVVDVLTSWIDRNARLPKSLTGEKEKNSVSAGTEDLEARQEQAEEQASLGRREALAHLNLGRGYLLLNDHAHAKEELMKAIVTAKGSNLAREADELLFALPKEMIAPKIGKASADDLKLISLSGALANDKPSVLLFCAPWVESCRRIKEHMAEVTGTYASRINFVEIDADDPANNALLQKFEIGPLPAVLFLSGSNEVVSYILGDDENGLRSGLSKITDPAWGSPASTAESPNKTPLPQ